MTQDVSSAADTLEERISHTVLLKKPSIVLSNFEGGGTLGKMHTVFGHDWEVKSGIPLAKATHVKDMTSTGGPFGTGISIPDPENPTEPLYTCKDMMSFYDEDCAIMFAEKPSRIFKLVAASGINLVKRILDPRADRKDRAHIETIKRYCDILLAEVPADKRELVTQIRDRATKNWLSAADTEAALSRCKKIATDDPGNPKKKIPAYKASEAAKNLTDIIGLSLNKRSTAQSGRLKTEFTRAVVKAMDAVQARLGPRENRLYDPQLREDLFRKRMGERRLNDLIGSNYFAAYNPRQKEFDPIFSRRYNLLDLDPKAPATVSHPDMRAWDANMGTTANLLAYPPHRTQDGTLMVDKATIHTPMFTISEICAHKPRDMGVVSITFSTGHSVSNDMTDEQLYEFLADNGEAHEGFLDDSKAYSTSLALKTMANLIGKENIFVISPRMSWKDYDEMLAFPSMDITDASPENMAKVQRRAEKYIRDKEPQINRIWQVLADNLYMLGQIDRPKFDEITERLGVKAALNAAAHNSNVTTLPVAAEAQSSLSLIPNLALS